MRVRLSRPSLFLLLLSLASWVYAETWPGECIVKFRGTPTQWTSLSKLQTSDAQIARLLTDWQVSRAVQSFPDADGPEKSGGIELRTWWKFYVPKTTDIEAMVAAFSNTDAVLSAQASVVYRVFEDDLTYNDTRYSAQWYLRHIHASQAADYCTGDTTIVIAIVDLGVDYNHFDLRDNMWHDSLGHHGFNYMATSPTDSTNPMPISGGEHGTHCAGLASARTNNANGIASLGYKCKIMGVRAGDTQYITYGYQGIVWAANHNADVISCSWGGTGVDGQGQDAVNYAWNHNCVVLCAAGNDGYYSTATTPHYPAAFNNVISVAASDSTEHKSDFSCYGSWVKITSPGSSIISTYPSSPPGSTTNNNAYVTWDGTSMATPIAAGLAALIKSRIGHTATNANIRDIIFACCVPIDTVAHPRSYANGTMSDLGYGRIDAERAMLLLNAPSLQYQGEQMTFNADTVRLVPGGSANLSVYLQVLAAFGAVDSGSVHIVCTDPGISFDNSTATFGHINSGSNWDNEAAPFHVHAATNMTPHLVTFRVQVQAQPTNVAFENEFTYFVGWQEALIVDGDNGDAYQSYYESALTTLGVSHDTYDLLTMGSFPSGYLNNFHWVLWETGNDSAITLDSYSQSQITNYLSNGGKIFLSSQFLPRDQTTASFLANVIHAAPLHNWSATPFTNIRPIPGSQIAQGNTFRIIGGGGGANGLISQITLLPDSTGSCHPCFTLGTTNEACAVYRDVGTGAIVYLSIAAEAISSSSNTGPLSDLLGNVRNFFQNLSSAPEIAHQALPTSIKLGEAYPNPFNSTTVLSLALPATQNVTLTVYDQLGRTKMHSVYHNMTVGTHNLSITLPEASSGIYFAQIRTSTGTTLTRKLVYLR